MRITGVLCTFNLRKRDAEVKLLLGCTPKEENDILSFSEQGANGRDSRGEGLTPIAEMRTGQSVQYRVNPQRTLKSSTIRHRAHRRECSPCARA